ncbi:putative protein gravitropic in the light 1 [Dioscorea sansibarensis]
METARLAAPKTLKKAFTSILRARRGPDEDDATARKLKPSKTLGQYPTVVLSDANTDDPKKEQQKQKQQQKKETESLLDNIFVSISGIKASYAQLQLAQSPYNPDVIQNADEAIVFQLKNLSQLKHSYLKNQPFIPQSPLSTQIQEQQNLLKTYQITIKKLESELHYKDDEVHSLESQLLEAQTQCSTIEAKLHPNRSLSALRGLHLSGLNPTHFLSALRYTVKSLRHFVKHLTAEMDSAGWDLHAAATAIHPDAPRRDLTFESYVSLKMFSDFQRPDYGLRGLDCCGSWDQHRFFDEFSSSTHLSWNQLFKRSAQASEFVRAKYLAVVHPKMEASFFGDLEQRSLLSSGSGFPDSELFADFAEMARRLWLLHCLFFSFSPAPAIFQAARGVQFSDVFMENVVGEEATSYGTGRRPTVAFTVVPGFRVGQAVIQCRVCLSSKTNQRS